MGQQQLLLVILVTIIVGIATVVAINTFGTAADQANLDAVTNDVSALASAAQGYFMRSEMLGGGGRKFDGLTFERLAFAATGISAAGDVAENENGRYVITDADGQEFTITAYPSSRAGYTPGELNDGVLVPGADGDGVLITAVVGPNTFDLNPPE